MAVAPSDVHSVLSKYQLADGYDLVVDLEKSHGCWIHDSSTGREFLDAFTCFASWPLGFNHPELMGGPFNEEILKASRNKIANSDLYTTELATFVEEFGSKVTPEDFPHHFWVSGGALAVENALKTAFDWKARKLGRTNFHDDVNDLVILHFEQAFHGRSGYTMSLTNTLPDKIGLFPKFAWPRVSNPFCEFDNEGKICNDIEAAEAKACEEIERAFEEHSNRIAAIIIEPMQGEGGDNHFRDEFFEKLRQYADEREALLIFDEVQTGFYGSGKTWFWQHTTVRPDIVCFGKKTQTCGIYVSRRVDEIVDNVFKLSSRINSTWGGNLVDMVRCTQFIKIIERDEIADLVTKVGNYIIAELRNIASESGLFTSVRGRGSLIAFTMQSQDHRNAMLKAFFNESVLALPCGVQSVRFRLPLIMTIDDANQLLSRTRDAVQQMVATV
ncbi:MAG: L-lysine 6-transaminase [Phycisphaerales bacterium]|jgi:L-lysine 6-transaminase|nr:L-lysine 6-transaminase [Phycisphaerales bacterium]